MPLLIEIAEAEAAIAACARAAEPEAAILDDVRRRGVPLHPTFGWWPC